VYAARGQLDEADKQLGVTRALSESAGDVIRLSQAIGLAGFLKNFQGDYAEASRLLSESLRLAREHKLLVPLLDAFFMYGVTLTGKGDYDAAHAVFQEGLALSEKIGDELWRHRILNSLGWLYLELGDLERGADLNRRATEGAQKRGDHEQIANAEINLGDAFMAKGDLALAQEFLDRVYRLVKDPATSEWGRWRYSTHLFASLGDLWLARGDTAKAREFADQCLEIATRTKARKNLVKGWRLRGEIGMAGRQWDEAEEALREALTVAQMIGNPSQLWKTHAALGRLSAQRNKPDAAHQAYQAARLVIEGIKGRLRSPDLLRSLETAPLIQQVRALGGPRAG
ncbi:MAG: tetratricopeptide repeat protein, partial [Nitrospiraceae bacterium]